MLNKGDKVGIVVCSNGQPKQNQKIIDELLKTLEKLGLKPICSKYIYSENEVFSANKEVRAEILMEFYKNKEIKAIFDISGGDIANEVLDYLDFEIIKENKKMFFGYSDLTTIINAIYKKTENISCLYQVRNLVYNYKDTQISDFRSSIMDCKDDLFTIDYKFLRGEKLEGIVVGGNIRCLLKLAGTEYMPDFKEKVLLLESYGGEVPQMITFLTQLKQIGIFKNIKGILLGTFIKMEENKNKPSIEELVLEVTEEYKIPIVKTFNIGHRENSKAILIGSKINLDIKKEL